MIRSAVYSLYQIGNQPKYCYMPCQGFLPRHYRFINNSTSWESVIRYMQNISDETIELIIYNCLKLDADGSVVSVMNVEDV